jgi:hypothetical protein
MVTAKAVEKVPSPGVKIILLKLLSFSARIFRRQVPTKQFSQATKPFSVFEQTSGNSRWLSVTNETAHNASARTETANADNQLHPGLRFHPGRSPDSWFFRRQPSRHRHLLLQQLAGYRISTDGRCCELIAIPTKFRRRM